MDTLLRRAHLQWLRLSSTISGQFSENAGLLKNGIIPILIEHLQEESTADPEQEDELSIAWAREVSNPVKDALRLKADTWCAREKYPLGWPKSGEAFDAVSMEATYANSSRGAVLMTVFPGVEMQKQDAS